MFQSTNQTLIVSGWRSSLCLQTCWGIPGELVYLRNAKHREKHKRDEEVPVSEAMLKPNDYVRNETLGKPWENGGLMVI